MENKIYKSNKLDPAITNTIIKYLIFLIPILSCIEVFALTFGTAHIWAINFDSFDIWMHSWNTTYPVPLLTPIPIKLLKDLGLLILLVLGGVFFVSQFKYQSKLIKAVFISFCIILFTSILFSIKTPLITILCGIRWAYPFFLCFFLLPIVNTKTIQSVKRPLEIVFFIHLALQIIQFVSFTNIYGINSYGFSARSPGIFVIPITGAFFSIMYFYISIVFLNNKKKAFYMPAILTFLSVILTQSFTAFIVLTAVIPILLVNKKYFILNNLVVIPLASLLFLISFLYFNSRGFGLLESSGGIRMEIFINTLESAKYFVTTTFGAATNSANLASFYFSQTNVDAVVTDSTLTAAIINLGLPGLLLYVILIISFTIKAILSRSKTLLALIVIILCLSLTSSITEAFPMNLFIPIIIACLFNSKNIRSPKE